MELGICTSTRGSTVVVAVTGDIDIHTAPQLEQCLAGLLAEGRTEVVVDLAGVSFLDSSALGVLIEARTKLEDRTTFLLAAPGLETHRALSISGLDQHLAVHDTVDAALAAKLN